MKRFRSRPVHRGRIDDVRLYRGAISEAMVRELYEEDGWTGN